MNIKLLNKNLIAPITGGILILLSFLYVTYENSDKPLISQIESVKIESENVNKEEIKLKKYQNSEIGNIQDNYIDFVKNITVLFRNTPEVSGFSLIVNDSNDGLLNSGIKVYENNSNLKYLYCEAQINLNTANDIDKHDFYTNYKPLKYFQNIADNKTVIIETVSKNDRMYVIKFKILGK